jgi:hypothetical protein
MSTTAQPVAPQSGSLLITSNHPFSARDTIFPDNMMAVAAIDRPF